MSKVIFDISMSLDGFVTASNRTYDEPMGKDGERLHEWGLKAWAGEDERNLEFFKRSVAGLGASIAGRRTYDDSIRYWGPNGPAGAQRQPLIVVTHEEPEEVPENSVYTFVTDGIESALEQARSAAGGKDVAIMGGADVAQQYIAAGLVDEIQIHLVPILFGNGLRLFDHLGDQHIELERIEVVDTAAATHLRYRVQS
jgi:dihydrofolate reductase